ncbi:MAG: cyclodeaminase/cyclohydrolase family protein [Candidatus Omnitrophica bacterium]|nr:cyclodeaminase/cyclohydrolase family protein [Candidatus Omnitrophota bacterium]
MKIQFSDTTLNDYLDQLSRKEPVPGGGSAAAVTAALGAGLVSMVANYSIGRKANTPEVDKKFNEILKKGEVSRKRFLELASLDSEAYLQLCAARSLDVKAQKKASQGARAVPLEICKLCYKTLDLIPFLVDKGNPYLLSDVEVAIELLNAGYNGAMVMVRINS